jgi:hypothetical protein
MLDERRAAEESVSRGPELAVDVSSRMRSRSREGSLPELHLEPADKTAVRPEARKEST